ncbi:DnaB-like helicase N-terminal domain-containing protein [Streptomyces sp. NBC_00400]|uniref:DnaB-like helicase N-terminal domain-containing protein n=1 Tax=Streptomyces sp. NBC_00400 TaxID=2975737 RepID=UPI002E1DCA29
MQPDDFTHPLHAGLWQCLVALTRRDTPVDPVTALWEAQHRGLLGAGAEPSELLDLLAGPVGSPESWGERVLQRSVPGVAASVGASRHSPRTRPARRTSSSPAAAALSPICPPYVSGGSTPPHPRR